MSKELKALYKLQSLFEEKHKRDEVFQAFGFAQCHQLDWEIRYTIGKLVKQIKKVSL